MNSTLGIVTGNRPIEALLVDRDSDTRLMYATYLSRFDVELDEAEDGRVAPAKALARPHNVVVTDTRLLGLNGYELCRLLRRDSQTKNTPIIVLTAEAFADNLSRAHRVGADAVLVKPCLPDALLAEIRRQIRRVDGLQERARDAHTRAAENMDRSRGVLEPVQKARRQRAMSRQFDRTHTTAPPSPPAHLRCP